MGALRISQFGAGGRDASSGQWSSGQWSPDLGRAIGSARWFGDFAALIALTILALAFWPGALPAPFRSEALSAPPAQAPVRPIMRTAAPSPRSPPLTVATLRAGETLHGLLVRRGIPVDEAAQADALVAAGLFPGTVPSATSVSLQPGDGRRVRRITLRPRLDLELAVVRGAAGLVLERRAIPVETVTRRLRGPVGRDLARAIAAAGGPPEAVLQYHTAIASGNLASGIEPGDSFDLVATVRRAADGQTQFGDVLYAAVFRSGRPLAEMLRWGNDNRFRDAGSAVPRGGPVTIWPVNGHFTSGYGLRFHPILGYARLHAGVDIGAPWGTPIYAVDDGIVAFAGWHGGHGKYIRIEHGDGRGTGYAHLSRIAVAPGARVSSGTVIGYVGSTGLSTGPHLHYEVYRNGRSVDPATARFAGAGAADESRRADFRAAIAALKALSPIEPAPGDAAP